MYSQLSFCHNSTEFCQRGSNANRVCRGWGGCSRWTQQPCRRWLTRKTVGSLLPKIPMEASAGHTTPNVSRNFISFTDFHPKRNKSISFLIFKSTSKHLPSLITSADTNQNNGTCACQVETMSSSCWWVCMTIAKETRTERSTFAIESVRPKQSSRTSGFLAKRCVCACVYINIPYTCIYI